MVHGAGDGNRTHTTSLEGWDSTIELHPQFFTLDNEIYSITSNMICQEFFQKNFKKFF